MTVELYYMVDEQMKAVVYDNAYGVDIKPGWDFDLTQMEGLDEDKMYLRVYLEEGTATWSIDEIVTFRCVKEGK